MIERGKVQLGGTARSPEDVEALSAMGMKFAEVPVTRPETFPEKAAGYRNAGARTGLRYLCHGPREGDPNDTETLEGIYLPKVMGVISLMPTLDMRLLTVHLWMDSRFVSRTCLTYKMDLLLRLTDAAAATSVILCLENLSETAEQLSDLLKEVPGLMLTLDVGHAQLLTKRNTAFRLIERYPDRIRHIHLHDNRGGTSPSDDLHLPVGRGMVDFASIFQALFLSGYGGTMTLELRPREIQECLPLVADLLLKAGFEVEGGPNLNCSRKQGKQGLKPIEPGSGGSC